MDYSDDDICICDSLAAISEGPSIFSISSISESPVDDTSSTSSSIASLLSTASSTNSLTPIYVPPIIATHIAHSTAAIPTITQPAYFPAIDSGHDDIILTQPRPLSPSIFHVFPPHAIIGATATLYAVTITLLLYAFFGFSPADAFIIFDAYLTPTLFTAIYSNFSPSPQGADCCVIPLENCRLSDPLAPSLELPPELDPNTSTLASPMFLAINTPTFSNCVVFSLADLPPRCHIQYSRNSLSLRAMADTGSQVTTSHDHQFIHRYRPITFPKFLNAANKVHDHPVIGTGFLLIPTGDKTNSTIPTWYTPSLRATVIYPGEQVPRFPTKYTAHTVYSHHTNEHGKVIIHGRDRNDDISIYTTYTSNKAMTIPLISYPAIVITTTESVATIEANRVLLHNRMGHFNH